MKHLAGICIAVGNSFFGAFVLTRLWVWFLVPLGVPAVGMAHAYGIALIVGWLTFKTDHQKRDADQLLEGAVVRVIAALLAWGIGAIAHGFM